MAKRRSWKTEHKTSGATVIERRAHGCRLTVMPFNWSHPHGAASWGVSCGSARSTDFKHKRGRASTVKNAKVAATRAAKAMGR